MGTRITFILLSVLIVLCIGLLVYSGILSLHELNPLKIFFTFGVLRIVAYLTTFVLGVFTGRSMLKYWRELQQAIGTDGADVLILAVLSLLLGFVSFYLFASIEVTAWLLLTFSISGALGAHWQHAG